jgi:hypothetical protein
MVNVYIFLYCLLFNEVTVSWGLASLTNISFYQFSPVSLGLNSAKPNKKACQGRTHTPWSPATAQYKGHTCYMLMHHLKNCLCLLGNSRPLPDKCLFLWIGVNICLFEVRIWGQSLILILPIWESSKTPKRVEIQSTWKETGILLQESQVGADRGRSSSVLKEQEGSHGNTWHYHMTPNHTHHKHTNTPMGQCLGFNTHHII